MKISIQTIVFNAESILPKGMLQKNIEQWVDIADEIIIVEGATKATSVPFDGSTEFFTSTGNSTDNTRGVLLELKEKYPNIQLIFKNGFWDGKTSMFNEACKKTTGDYIWQVDSDEFYHEKDIPIILKLLEEESPDAVHFYANHFYGGFNTYMDESQPWGNDIPWKRIFKNSPGSYWKSHEPPEYISNGRLCNLGKVISRESSLSLGIKMYHYSCVAEKQINFKSKFFNNPSYEKDWKEWQKNNSTPIFRATTKQFTGTHPSCIQPYLK